MSHPYRDLPDACFWSRAVTWAPPGQLDPVYPPPGFRIAHNARVATMGSCFAQHLARHLVQLGMNHYVEEHAPSGVTADEVAARNYGAFSARYGNVYTVRQALQLFDRAYGHFHPIEEVWERSDRFVDPFRPTIEPDGFATPDALRAARLAHFGYVRAVFERCDFLVFTLGLTEAWRSKLDGAVFPLAPGVSGGRFDAQAHEFVNFSVAEVTADLHAFCQRVLGVNAGVRIILTVSPVPLIATYEQRHVLASSVYSKSVLRVAAEEISRALAPVEYFPSYEIFSSAAFESRYFSADLRQVTDAGVAHAMRLFARHFCELSELEPERPAADACDAGVICDEEQIDRAMRAGGHRATPESGAVEAAPAAASGGWRGAFNRFAATWRRREEK